jgi:hypothetical protein
VQRSSARSKWGDMLWTSFRSSKALEYFSDNSIRRSKNRFKAPIVDGRSERLSLRFRACRTFAGQSATSHQVEPRDNPDRWPIHPPISRQDARTRRGLLRNRLVKEAKEEGARNRSCTAEYNIWDRNAIR